MSDLWLVLDSVEDVIDGYPERDEVELRFISLAGFDSTPGWLVDSGGVVAQILHRRNGDFGFSISSPCIGGQLDVA